MIEFLNVSYVYGKDTPFEKEAVSNISFKIEDGLVTGIIGHTGSGKSTVARMMNALISPAEGKVLLNGADINESKRTAYLSRSKVGLVFQYPEYQLFEETVWKDIAFGPSNMGLSPSEIEERVLMASEFTGISRELLQKSPFDLSGGQKRRVAIAGVIAMLPDVLVLDEPAAGLDPRGRREILERLSKYKDEKGRAVVIISHSMEDVAEFSDRIIAVSDGALLAEGTPAQVFSHYDEIVASGLETPEVTSVMNELRAMGLDVPGDVFTVDEAYRILRGYVSEKGGN